MTCITFFCIINLIMNFVEEVKFKSGVFILLNSYKCGYMGMKCNKKDVSIDYQFWQYMNGTYIFCFVE